MNCVPYAFKPSKPFPFTRTCFLGADFPHLCGHFPTDVFPVCVCSSPFVSIGLVNTVPFIAGFFPPQKTTGLCT